MKSEKFIGLGCPVITCFEGSNGQGSIDHEAQKRVLEYVIREQGADFIIACASTGEAGLLSEFEYKSVAELCLQEVKKKHSNMPVILGTSSIDPNVVISRNKFAEERGFDGVLLTQPPYLKPDQRGIKNFFVTVAEATPNLPIIVYNIPHRTGGAGAEASTLVELSKISSVVGMKDSGMSIEHIDSVTEGTKNEDFVYLSGDDNALFDVLCHGGAGGILTVSHVVGRLQKEMIRLVKQGQALQALDIHRRIRPIVKLLFAEPNPVPVKAALNELGLAVGDSRGPTFLPATEKTKEALRVELGKLGING